MPSNNFLQAPPPAEDNPDGGRLPTPVYGHFSQAGAATGMLRLPSYVSQRNCGPVSPIPASPMSPGESATEAAWWQRRRLPSPAEEVEHEDTLMSSSVGMIDTMLPRLNVSPPNRVNIKDSHMSRQAMSVTSNPDGGSMKRTSSPFGRARSNATSVGTNPATVSTTRLSMGYRADCEKCIRRVPGHYTHIVR